MQIQYCFKCGVKLTNDHFETGRAFHVESQVSCSECSPNIEATKLNIIEEKPTPFHRPSPVRHPLPAARHSGKNKSGPMAVPPQDPGAGKTASRTMAAPPQEPGKPKWIAPTIGGGAALLVLIIVLLLVLGGGPDKPSLQLKDEDIGRPPKVIMPVPRPPDPDKVKPRPRDEVKPRLPEPRKTVVESPRTMEASELAALDSQVRNSFARQRYGSALKLLEEAKAKRKTPTWLPQVEKRIRSIRERIDRAFELELGRAVNSIRGGGNADILVARVRTWGVEGLSEKIEAEINRVREAMAATAERERMKAYLESWRGAMALAADRDYGSAVKKLNASMKEIKDKKVLAEIIQDIELLRRVRGIYQKALGTLKTWPKGKVLNLEYRDEKGEMKSFGGTVAASGPGWIELKKGKEIAWIDLAELAPRSLLEVSKAGGNDDPEAVAILSRLEGLEGAAKGLPERYASFAMKRPKKLRSKEATARSLFYATSSLERGFPEKLRRGASPMNRPRVTSWPSSRVPTTVNTNSSGKCWQNFS